MKRTAWMTVRTPPVRPGIYEFHLGDCKAWIRMRWNGKRWHEPGYSHETFEVFKDSDKWRGLTRAAYLKAGGK